MNNVIVKFRNNHKSGTLGAVLHPPVIEVTVPFGPNADCKSREDAITAAWQQVFNTAGREVSFIEATAVAS